MEAQGKLLCEALASFTAGDEGLDYQEVGVASDTPAPEDLPSEEEVARAEGWDLDAPGPLGGSFEWRWIGGTPWSDPAPGTGSSHRAWARPRIPLGPDPALRAAVLACLADYQSHLCVARRLGGRFDPIGFASLDQMLWVHRDLHWDDWWLLESESDIAHGGRALARRRLFATDGRLVATMAQEALVPSTGEAPQPAP